MSEIGSWETSNRRPAEAVSSRPESPAKKRHQRPSRRSLNVPPLSPDGRAGERTLHAIGHPD